MAIHVVGFRDIVVYEDGITPLFKGRALLDEYGHTAQYKRLEPGDFEILASHGPKSRCDFVAATPFDAELEISEDHYFYGPVATLYSAETNTFYPMFLTDFVHMASESVIDHGKVSGRFGYVKRNKNFGITYLGEAVGD